MAKVNWQDLYDKYINSENRLVVHIVPVVIGFHFKAAMAMFEEIKLNDEKIIICIQ